MLKVDEFFRLNVPDFWFIHWLLLGGSPLRIGLLVAVLLGLMILSGRRMDRIVGDRLTCDDLHRWLA